MILDELDGLLPAGRRVRLLHRRNLPAQPRAARRRSSAADVKFGVQTRIDLWNHECSTCSARAGCVSIEAGVESITPEGPRPPRQELQALDRRDHRAPDLRQAAVPFVQANLIDAQVDDPRQVERWREICSSTASGRTSPCRCSPIPVPRLHEAVGRARRPAWERALDHYLEHIRRVQRHPGRPSAAARSPRAHPTRSAASRHAH